MSEGISRNRPPAGLPSVVRSTPRSGPERAAAHATATVTKRPATRARTTSRRGLSIAGSMLIGRLTLAGAFGAHGGAHGLVPLALDQPAFLRGQQARRSDDLAP